MLANVPRWGGGADAGYIQGGRAGDRNMRTSQKNRLAEGITAWRHHLLR